MKSRIEEVIETFIKNEIASTDNRIDAIRNFVETLRGELVLYLDNYQKDTVKDQYHQQLLTLFRDMISTYDDEVQTLLVKRGRISRHLDSAISLTNQIRQKAIDSAHRANRFN